MAKSWNKKVQHQKIKDYIIKYYRKDSAVKCLVEDAVPDYTDDNWEEEGYDDELSWYADYGRGEAEGQIQQEIFDYVREKFPKRSISDDDLCDLIPAIFPCLKQEKMPIFNMNQGAEDLMKQMKEKGKEGL